ncbi:MAG: sigma-54 dependent transcriptional regulator [Thiobacillaceae bacterium]|nr:sigma-54 dependent transcriptional regulator [Thiobacillaceae bacterium]
MNAKPLVLVVEDDAALREALADTLELNGYAVALACSAEEALARLEEDLPGLMLSDVQMPGQDGHALLQAVKAGHPGLPVVLMTAYGQIDKAVQAMRDGAADYLPKPFEPDRLLAAVARHYRQPVGEADDAVVAHDPATRTLMALARRVAATDASVLLTGESGVGKEVLARYIHRHSHRRERPFLAVNCAAIPENLLEATLFGHEKGAFTGAAASQPGKFEQAQGGVILLDEISEIPMHLQVKLLRVLQEKEVERLGGRGAISLDVRVLAATNCDLSERVRSGRFREDLYYRLNVFPLEIPPLRARRGDIPFLARYCLERFAATVGRPGMGFSDAALAALTAYDWPGNIRELGNVVQRAMIMAPGQTIEPAHLMLPVPVAAVEPGKGEVRRSIKELERETILRALAESGGSRKKAAQILGMSERTLRYKLQRYREKGEIEGDNLL